MDKNLNVIIEKRALKTISNLEKNNMNGYFVNSKEEVVDIIKQIVSENAIVSVGGSMTLFECNVIDHLRSGRYEFLDRYKEGLKPEDIRYIYRESFFADAYFTSSNAITESGELYNVDGNGNRVAAMLYGPDKVIVVVGVNKIVKDIDEAVDRVKRVAAPANAIRLNKNTPCTEIGHCVNCNSEQRICSKYTVMGRQPFKGRVHVIIVNESLGY